MVKLIIIYFNDYLDNLFILIKEMEDEQMDTNIKEYFIIEYDKQNLNKNPKYVKWKVSMKQKHGKNIKFLQCKKDNIIFACSNESLKEDLYRSNCPVCDKEICYFCSHTAGISIPCCVQNSVVKTFLVNGFMFTLPMEEDSLEYIDYKKKFKLLITPFINLFMFIHQIQLSLFYDIAPIGTKEYNNYGNYLGKHDYIFELVFGINLVFDILLFIPYFLFSIYFVFLLLVFSVPFKNYPLKYFIGVAYGNYNLLT